MRKHHLARLSDDAVINNWREFLSQLRGGLPKVSCGMLPDQDEVPVFMASMLTVSHSEAGFHNNPTPQFDLGMTAMVL